MANAELHKQVLTVTKAVEDKKGENLAILKLDQSTSAFTDYFVICSGTNPRQIQAIADEVELRLKKAGMRPNNVEGYTTAEWVLLDYVDFVVHIFSESSRKFYDLERLWKSAHRLTPAELEAQTRKRVTKPATAKRAAKRAPLTRAAVKKAAPKKVAKRAPAKRRG
jgi:ribosome-associated protein